MDLEGNSLEVFKNEEIVLVTGFGSFRGYDENPSWEVVTELQEMDFSDFNVTLKSKKIPVEYDAVTNLVPELWETHKPKLVIHMGVSGKARNITLEKCAHRVGYKQPDASGAYFENKMAAKDTPDECITQLNLEAALETLNKQFPETPFTLSEEAGLYLCEFVYYTSLSIDSSRTVFVHVPDPSIVPAYSIPQQAQAIKALIGVLVADVRKNCGS